MIFYKMPLYLSKEFDYGILIINKTEFSNTGTTQ